MKHIALIIALLGSSALANAADLGSVSEASALVHIDNQLVIAGDEASDKVWRFNPADQSVAEIPLLPNGNELPDDLEGLTLGENGQILATTSMSLTKKGKYKTARDQILLLEWNADKTALSIAKAWNARESLITHLQTSLAGDSVDTSKLKNKPTEGGLNIEGLTYVGGTLYLGLREPVSDQGEAILVPVLNFQEAAKSNVELKWGTPTLISTGGRGIRDLSTTADGLLILSGPIGDSPDIDFQIGKLTTGTYQPEQNNSEFAKLQRPEGLAYVSDDEVWLAQDFGSSESGSGETLVRIKVR